MIIMSRSFLLSALKSNAPGLLIGIACFLVLVPLNVVLPSNIGWLGVGGDSRTYYLGWDFFRRSDWSWPISSNPLYGLEISGSVFMTDTVPLLAILLKTLRGVLPDVFQYHGAWLFFCFAMQGAAAWKLSGLITENYINRILICALFVFQIPFISRATVHLPLMGQFLILSALYICLVGGSYRRLWWLLLIAIAASINAYLLLMTMGLWFSNLVYCHSRGGRSLFSLFEIFLVLVVVLFVCWQIGYFSVGGGVRALGEYGIYRFNLLSPLDSDGWSYLLRDIPGGAGDYEGFAFLGLGGIFGVLVLFGALLSSRQSDAGYSIPGNIYLFCILFLFLLFAITNNIGVGPYSIGFPLPEIVERYASTFRGAGRLVWPVLYFSVFTVIYFLCLALSGRAVTLVLVLMLFMQVVDTSAGWRPVRSRVGGAIASEWESPLKDKLWSEIGSHYKSVRRLPAENAGKDWSVFADFAAKYGLSTDFIYMARVNRVALADLNRKNEEMIGSGSYREDSVYVLNDEAVMRALLNFNYAKDLILKLDGYAVILPNGKGFFNSNGKELKDLASYMGEYPSRHIYRTVKDSPGLKVLAGGWTPERRDVGVWSEGNDALVAFPVLDNNFSLLEISGFPLLSSEKPVQNISVSINGMKARDFSLKEMGSTTLRMELTADEKNAMIIAKKAIIKFNFLNVLSPRDLRINSDTRKLAYTIQSIGLQ